MDCQPTRYNYASLSGSYQVCFESNENYSFSAGQMSAMAAGLDYWNSVFSDLGVNISFSATYGLKDSLAPCPSTTNIIFSPSYDTEGHLALADLTTDGNGAVVRIDTTRLLADDQNWDHLAAHELGHILDYQDVHTNGCYLYTVMWQENDVVPTPSCSSDKVANSTRYKGGGGTNEDFQPAGGECYDVYLVREFYVWDGSDFYYVGSAVIAYLGQYCGPPPI